MKKAKPHVKPEIVKKELQADIEKAKEDLQPVHKNEIHARVEKGPQGKRVFTLESAEHPYRVFCEALNECVAIMTKEGTILHCNKRLAEMLSTSFDKIIGRSFYHLVVPQDRQALKTKIQAPGTKGFRGEFLLKTSGKKTIPVLLSVSPVMIDIGNFCLLITDLSEQKRVQKSLESEILVRKETEKALGRFNEALEQRVKERTAELQRINNRLQAELAERKEMEERMARLASFPELNPNPIVESDLNGHIEYLNLAAQDLFPDLQTAGPSHPWMAGLESVVDRCLKEENPLLRELKIGESWFQQTIHYTEKYQRLRFYSRDITERMKAEEELLEAYKGLENRIEERTAELRRQVELLDLAHDAIIVRGIHGEIMFWSSGAETTYGWTKEEALGKFSHHLLQTKFPMTLEEIMDIITRESRWEGELIHICKDGKQIVVHSRWAMRPGKTPGSQEIMEINHDISGRKRAEEILRQAGAYNRTLIEASLDPLVTIDPQGMISDVNTATELATGYSRGELIGTDFSDYFTDPEKARAGYQQVFKEGFVRDYALEIHHKDGRLTPVLYNATVYRDEEGKVIGVFAAARDITEKNKLERQLRHSQMMEAIGTLAGGIAHDFNNIVAGIIGLAEMVLEDLPERDPNHRKLELILKGAIRGRELIKQILTFSRQGEQEKKPVSMRLILNEATPFIRASIPSTIEIRQNIISHSDLIAADKTQIYQVILNLCANAAYAMRDRGGTLEINLKDEELEDDDPRVGPDQKPGSYLNLTIRDTGCGIEPEFIEKIFEPFFTTKSTGEGTGLGLSVVHGIVKSHNGIIRVYSQPGQGSSFQVFIPKILSELSSEADKVSALPRGKESILFVDDEDILVEMGTQRLTRLGYTTIGKISSLEALEAFRNEPDKYDLVVTDYTMPNMTGLELSKEMLRLRPDLPIIMCSGLNEPVPIKGIKEVGVKEFFVKPIDKDDFAKLVRRVLDQAKGQNQKEGQ